MRKINWKAFFEGAIVAIIALLLFAMVKGAMGHEWNNTPHLENGKSGLIISQQTITGSVVAWYHDFNENGKIDMIRIVGFFEDHIHVLKTFDNCKDYNEFWKKKGWGDKYGVDENRCD